MNDEDLKRAFEQIKQQSVTAPPHLAKRILANLPERDPLERLWHWFSASLWRAAATAALPLLVGFVLGASGIIQTGESWEEAEVLVFADTLAEYEYDEI